MTDLGALLFPGKVKVLLKELWLCVNAAHRLSGESSRRIPGERSHIGSSHMSVIAFAMGCTVASGV